MLIFPKIEPIKDVVYRSEPGAELQPVLNKCDPSSNPGSPLVEAMH